MIPLDSIIAINTLLLSMFQAIDKDAINGGFELSAGFFVLNHCRVLYLHKETRGVSMLSVIFFTVWGLWNPWYYSALNQPLSFYGGLFVVAANALYVGMMFSYRRRVLSGEIYIGSGR